MGPSISTATPLSTTEELLASVARALEMKLVNWRATRAEPTSNGEVHAYTVELADAAGLLRTESVFVETNPRENPRPDVLRLRRESGEAFDVWLYPADPVLPVLSRVVYPDSATALLAELGVRLHVETLVVDSYRPGQRAVIRATGAEGTVFLKIVKPAKAAVLADKHKLFESSGLVVPSVLGWSPDGVVVLSQLPGVEAQNRIIQLADQEEAFLDSMRDLFARIGSVPAIYTARASLVDSADWYIGRLTQSLPDAADEIALVGSRILELRDEGRAFLPSPVTTHGDLHLGQIFVDPDEPTRIVGLLDIDTAGAGDVADDAAALYAHLHALACSADYTDPVYAAACRRLAANAAARWRSQRNSGFAVRARAIAATHLLGHAMRSVSGGAPVAGTKLLAAAGELVYLA
ncbi:MAG: uncharacterized protein JWR53_1629 [Glaciihabitans sp.]|jgi:aminoglycoside phosphotransferase|nr:uncharacterized protein [Glaciihabitans sp.]MCU1535148.1 uncharacterized protein [Glaciihabitans sp.]